MRVVPALKQDFYVKVTSLIKASIGDEKGKPSIKNFLLKLMHPLSFLAPKVRMLSLCESVSGSTTKAL